MNELAEMVLRLALAGVLGGVIGAEREYRGKVAGTRTHLLVALGSALMLLVSQHGFGAQGDPGRVAAQIVSGIGFIGAGLIIFQKNVIRGLTTAAGLWVTSAIGLTCGAGLYLLAAATTALVLLCLEALNLILRHVGTRNMSVTLSSRSKESVRKVAARIKTECVEMYTYNIKEKGSGEERTYSATIEMKVKRNGYDKWMDGLLAEHDGVEIVSVE